MSELKEHLFCECDEFVREYRGQLSNEMRPYYLKSEADKVIAEKDEKIDELKERIDELQKATDSAWGKVNTMYDELRHNKYKRCLAIAKWCDDAYNRECGLNPEEMTDKEFYKQQIEFWPRWSSKWLAIAEKFKPNSTAQ